MESLVSWFYHCVWLSKLGTGLWQLGITACFNNIIFLYILLFFCLKIFCGYVKTNHEWYFFDYSVWKLFTSKFTEFYIIYWLNYMLDWLWMHISIEDDCFFFFHLFKCTSHFFSESYYNCICIRESYDNDEF